MGRHTKDAVALLALAAGAFLRVDALGVPSYWLDEVLGQNLTLRAAAQPWWRWIAGFAEEHGPLYYATQLVARAFGTSELAGRIAPALFGVATIMLVWLAARALLISVGAPAFGRAPEPPAQHREPAFPAPEAPAVCAILLAISPLHVYYSREARPYALVLLLTAALVLILLRGGSTAAACAVMLGIAYTSAVGAPVIAAAIIVALALRRWPLVAAGIVIGGLFPLLYRSESHIAAPLFPKLDAAFVMTLLRNFSVSALGAPIGGRAAVAMFALFAIGAVMVARRDRSAAIVLIGMTLLPAGITIIALRVSGHWFGARYVTPALIGYVLLAGYAIAALARRLPAAAIVIALVLAAQGWPAARREPFQKLDWRAVTAKIRGYAHPGDLVIAGESSSEVPLRYYLHGVRLEGVPYPQVAEALTAAHPGTWLVSVETGTDAMRNWMCRYQLVLASALEGFRMHYAGDFLRERGGPAEFRAFDAATPRLVVDLAAAENPFLDGGWANPEGFRWATGTRAAVTIPRWGARDRVVRMRVMPMDNPALPPQTMTLTLNGKSFGQFVLPPGWSERELVAPATLWVDGLNTLAFDFGRAAAPADLDPKATDRRKLAVAFAWITIDGGVGAPPALNRAAIRIASAPFIDENSAWRLTRTRFPPAPPALTGRLGFDPAAAPRAHLEDLIESIAYGSDCEDDRAFLQRAFGILLGRGPDVYEEHALARLPRERIPVRLTKSQEFRRAVFGAVPDRSSAPGTRTPGRRRP